MSKDNTAVEQAALDAARAEGVSVATKDLTAAHAAALAAIGKAVET